MIVVGGQAGRAEGEDQPLHGRESGLALVLDIISVDSGRSSGALFLTGMFDTIYPADSVEFCPDENLHDIFVVGTYKLDQEDGDMERKTPQHRRGQCRVFKMTSGTNL